MEIGLQAALLAIGFLLLVKGADWFVAGASALAEKCKIPPLVIGLTVVAMGTSLPEASVSISAALKGNAEITVGNIVGSNILNILIILGLSALFHPLLVKKTTLRYELPFLTGITGLLLLQGQDGTISRADGLILLCFFALYVIYLLLLAKKKPETDKNNAYQQKLWKIVLLVVLGLAATVVGSALAVDAACVIARLLGMSERFIGLTIVALGTSLPELFTSVSAARRGDSDLAIGNIVGSNIFNILLIIGLSAAILPVPFAPDFRFDCLAAIAAAVLLLFCCGKNNKLKRWHGAMLLAVYAVYFFIIF